MKTALVLALFVTGAAAQTDAACARYKALLVEEIGAARDHLQDVKRRGEVLSEIDSKRLRLGVDAEIAALDRELFAFESGLFPAQPAAGSAEARRQYRAMLEKAIEFASASWKLEVVRQRSGAGTVQEVYAARKRILEAQKQLAAFDAGLTRPVILVPGGER
ncbi:MAG: hypothetical protein LAQ30_19980 [Acidobacteriia bacterium]|nr:hypothetical protein [Terriglobia bacterium]